MSMTRQVAEKLSTLVTAAFGFVAALAWNEAVKTTFQHIFGSQSNLAALYTYAVLVTLVSVLVTVWIAKFKN